MRQDKIRWSDHFEYVLICPAHFHFQLCYDHPLKPTCQWWQLKHLIVCVTQKISHKCCLSISWSQCKHALLGLHEAVGEIRQTRGLCWQPEGTFVCGHICMAAPLCRSGVQTKTSSVVWCEFELLLSAMMHWGKWGRGAAGGGRGYCFPSFYPFFRALPWMCTLPSPTERGT